ncbi:MULTISPECIES: hypothetical protein [unclassified Nostoc]|uniref:hypothetical protein n=1 Tax=unclassified Nostoc TaxID=2593658 RepID=UPI002627A419|nr:hypothetical protein [Nostoc sp. S13]MDF5736698.1 hypothetical protein [Nostoc sp. S13]
MFEPLIPNFYRMPQVKIAKKSECDRSSGSPIYRRGLGWGKTLVNQLFQTCVYTVAC